MGETTDDSWAVSSANLPFQETPMSAAVGQTMSSRIHNNIQVRDPSAGEIPQVPPRSIKTPKPGGIRSRSRNTAFDDPGLPAAVAEG
jgi:hypothetical protein